MTTTRTEGTHCPECDHLLDAHSSVDVDVGPKPGDYTVCVHCAAVLTFRDRLRLEVATKAELLELSSQQPDVVLQLTKIRWAVERQRAAARRAAS